MKIKNTLDMCGNEIQNAVAENRSSLPDSPKEGMFYYSTSRKAFMIWDGSRWMCLDPSQVLKFKKLEDGVLGIMRYAGGDDGSEPIVTAVQLIDPSDFDAAGTALQVYGDMRIYVDRRFTELIGGAPETLDTLKEIADALEDCGDLITALQSLVAPLPGKSRVICPELTPSNGVCTWTCNHGLTLKSFDHDSAVLCDVYTASGEKIVCDIKILSLTTVDITFASDEVIPAGTYYAVFVG